MSEQFDTKASQDYGSKTDFLGGDGRNVKQRKQAREAEVLVIFSKAKPGQIVRLARKWLNVKDAVTGVQPYASFAGKIAVLTRSGATMHSCKCL